MEATPPPRPALPLATIGFWAAWLIALWLKVLVATLDGTIDVQLYAQFASKLVATDLPTAYASEALFNHTPATAGYCELLAQSFGPKAPAFGFFLRLPGILGEAIFAIFLWRRCVRASGLASWIAAIYVLNPMAIGVTGFHGNVDGLLAVFLGAALLSAADQRPVLCGVWFALAANLKVSPLLLAPVFFFWWMTRGRAMRFTVALVIVLLLGYSPALLACPRLFVEKVLAYGGLWGSWGISHLLYLTGWPAFHDIDYAPPSFTARVIATSLKLLVVAATFSLAWRRRRLGPHGLAGTLAAVWTVFFTIAPGGAPQYLIWLLLPLLIYHVRLALLYLAAALPLLIVFYPPAVALALGFNFYPLIVEIYPGFIEPATWMWPALFLWAALLALLIREAPRWWQRTEDPAAGLALL